MRLSVGGVHVHVSTVRKVITVYEPSVASRVDVHVDVTEASATIVEPEASAIGKVARAIAAAEFANRVLRNDEENSALNIERFDTLLPLRLREHRYVYSKTARHNLPGARR